VSSAGGIFYLHHRNVLLAHRDQAILERYYSVVSGPVGWLPTV
jgi:hypothetical protein